MHHALSAGLNGGSAKQGLTYKWEVSPGTITSGQGGPSLTVEMPECECDFNVRLEVGGLEPGCPKTVEWGIRDLCFYPVGAESYGGIGRDEERALLSKYAPLLKRQCWQMRITAHGEKAGPAGEMLARAERAKRYIVEEHGVEAERVTVTGGGPQDERRISLLVFHGRLERKGGGHR